MNFITRSYINGAKKKKKRKTKVKKIQSLNKTVKFKSRNTQDIINRRYIFISVIMVICFIAIGGRLFQLQVMDYQKYADKLAVATEKIVEGSSAPRGRIYDRNYKLLVDNKAIKTIYYKKEGASREEEIALAYKIGSLIKVDYDRLSDYRLRYFYYLNHYDKCVKKINKDEWDLLYKRKISDIDIENMILDRISEEELEEYNSDDLEAAYIYYLMNKGYSYNEKIIKNRDVTEEEYAIISENIESLHGFNTKLDWDRIYLYGNTFKSILGTVSSNTQGIPEELADDYLEKGYTLEDRVGTSYLEYQYEDYLRGTKAKYKVINNRELELVSYGKRGNDIVLTIDIDLQKYLEAVLAEEVVNAKSEPNTKYYNRSFAVIANPNTGEILAMAGKQVKYKNNKYEVIDYTPGVVTLPVTPGSIVKGASMMVGYKYGAIDIGSMQVDECIKIQATPLKCSWRTMGLIDDLYALRYSSNVYQYKIAIRVGHGNYRYDQPLRIDTDAFNKYRNMYASFGLGVKTGIDLPVESLGYSGTSKLPGHLLDFAIGQYDTYTPIQLSQYINTLANGGNKMKPYLLKEVYTPADKDGEVFGDLVYEAKSEVMGKVDIDKRYMDRVRLGFNQVMTSGLGYGYMGYYNNSGGKTGTSQSFIDTDGNGVVDTETISSSFVGYAPNNNPKMSIVVVSPDISIPDLGYQSMVTKRISSRLVNKYFEIYK